MWTLAAEARAVAAAVAADLVVVDLRDADARGYRQAARRLRRMRKLAVDTDRAAEVDDLIGAQRRSIGADLGSSANSTRRGLP